MLDLTNVFSMRIMRRPIKYFAQLQRTTNQLGFDNSANNKYWAKATCRLGVCLKPILIAIARSTHLPFDGRTSANLPAWARNDAELLRVVGRTLRSVLPRIGKTTS
jgi:hypothetical protein